MKRAIKTGDSIETVIYFMKTNQIMDLKAREREKSWESYYQRNNAKNFVVEGKHKTSN